MNESTYTIQATPIRVSVIIPVYNAGEYLRPCLEALMAQTLQEMEFIFVLDCPTDGSDVLVKQYAQKDKRFVVIENEENLHIGLSRNRGIEAARGEYIAFCDHDDIMRPEMYQELYDFAASQSYDIVMSIPATRSNQHTEVWEQPIEDDRHIRETILTDLISKGGSQRGISLFCNIHNNLYLRQLLLDHNILFIDTKIITPEDVIFNIQTTYAAKLIGTLPHNYYQHNIIDTSTGHQTNYLDWRKRHNGTQYIYHFLLSNHIYPEYKDAFYWYVQKQYLNSLLSIIIHHRGFREWITAYRTLRSTPYTRDAFRHYHDYIQRPWHKKIARKILAHILAL